MRIKPKTAGQKITEVPLILKGLEQAKEGKFSQTPPKITPTIKKKKK